MAASGCAARRGQHALSPPPTPTEFGLAAQALTDSFIGPFFSAERLADAVALLRRVHRESPVVMPSSSELSWHPSLQFQMTDSLFGPLFGSSAGQPEGFVNRWLQPPLTDWGAFDSITAAMGGAVVIHIEGLQPSSGFVTVYYREPVNVPGVARAYAGLRPAATISIFQGLIITANSVADRWRIVAGDSIWTVHLPAGWGDDCPKRLDRRPCEFKYRPATGRLEAKGQPGNGQRPRVPALPPDSVPSALWDEIHAPENIIPSSPEWGVPFPRNLIVLAFKEDATQTERQQAIDAVGGEVIGGEHIDRGGYYYVRIRSDGTADAVFRAITKLKTFPKVDLASPEPPPISPESALLP
jgi:hypothetical protein